MEYIRDRENGSNERRGKYDDLKSLVDEHNLTKLRDKDLNALSPDNRKQLVRNEIRKIVQILGQDGITAREIQELTDVSDTTIRNHLEALRNLREVNKEKRNDQLYLYYPNARRVSGTSHRIEEGDTVIELKPAKGQYERDLIHVIEKSRSLMDGEKTEGAVTVPVEKVDEFFDAVNKIAEDMGEQ